MPGTITISTISDGTNSTSATNPILGSAKAWVNYNGVGTVTIRASFNVSSVTRISTGVFEVSFTSALTDANYVAVFMGGGGYTGSTFPSYGSLDTDAASVPLVKTASAVRYANFQPFNVAPSAINVNQAGLAIFR